MILVIKGGVYVFWDDAWVPKGSGKEVDVYGYLQEDPQYQN